jgi:hypothetical protein
MEEKRATITNFIKYLNSRGLGSVRLKFVFWKSDGTFYDHGTKTTYDDITAINEKSFLKVRNVGRKTLEEFVGLRTKFLEYLHSCDTDKYLKEFGDVKKEKEMKRQETPLEKGDTRITINDVDFIEKIFNSMALDLKMTLQVGDNCIVLNVPLVEATKKGLTEIRHNITKGNFRVTLNMEQEKILKE